MLIKGAGQSSGTKNNRKSNNGEVKVLPKPSRVGSSAGSSSKRVTKTISKAVPTGPSQAVPTVVRKALHDAVDNSLSKYPQSKPLTRAQAQASNRLMHEILVKLLGFSYR